MLELIRRALRLLREQGPTLALQKVYSRLRLWLIEREEKAFDRRYGTETSGVIYWEDYSAAARSTENGVGYRGCVPSTLRRAIRALGIDYRKFTFVDIGSGKGRALIIANEFCFQRVVGIELLSELHEKAQENVRCAYQRRNIRPVIECVQCDALAYQFPAEPLVVFFYNPLASAPFSALLAGLEASAKAHPRQIFVLYNKPLCGSVLESHPAFLRIAEEIDLDVNSRLSWQAYELIAVSGRAAAKN